jgi:hypothetical protein
VYSTPLMRSVFPTTEGSAPMRRCQRPWLTTMTGWAPST